MNRPPNAFELEDLQTRAAKAICKPSSRERDRLAVGIHADAVAITAAEINDLSDPPPGWLRELAFAETTDELREAVRGAAMWPATGGGWQRLPTDCPPDRDWVFPGWLPRGCTTILAGAGGAGKTQLALQMAIAVATGLHSPLPLHSGLRSGPVNAATDPRSAFFLEGEEASCSELWRRVFRLPRFDSGSREELREGVRDRLLAQRAAGPIWTPDGEGPGWSAVTEAIDAGARLLVLDNAAALYAADENSRSPVTGFLSALNALADEGGASIMLLTHPSAEKAVSGSTAWVNAARHVLELRKETNTRSTPAAERWTLAVTKANYAAPRACSVLFSATDGVGWLEASPGEAWREVLV